MDYIKPYLDYFSANPEWAILVIFLIAFGEALLIIGLFVPSTAVLVGAGMLVGTGHLNFWEVFLAAAVGCILGDQVSYWAGRLFGTRLKTMWPLNRYPALVVRGEDFVRQHGGKSIAVGRFIPGVKSVVPGIVGMLGMNQPFFVFVNVTSGIVWAFAHIAPGILLGQGLALAGELSGRLALVLVVLFVVLALMGWIIRLVAALFNPYVQRLLLRVSDWARTSNTPGLRRFGRAVAPGNPRAMALVAFLAILIAAFVALVDIILGLSLRTAASNLDQSVAAIMQGLRNAPADSLMTALTLLGDRIVLWTMGLAMAIWLIAWRAWRTALLILALMAFGEGMTLLLGWLVERPPPVAGLNVLGDSFPSRHAFMSGLVFGILAVLASHSMARWSKALVASCCGLLVVAIAFSRVYLNADWLSDVLGGLLCSAILAALFGMLIEAVPSRRIRPLGLMGLVALVGTLAGTAHVNVHHEKTLAAYAPASNTVVFDETTWKLNPWQSVPLQRVDLAGQPEERFAAQWHGDLDKLAAVLESAGWSAAAPWTWQDSISYLDTLAPIEKLPPRPLLHQGQRAKKTLTRKLPGEISRQVVRLYRSTIDVQGAETARPVYLVDLTVEAPATRLWLLSLPRAVHAEEQQIAALLGDIRKQEGVRQLPTADSQPAVFQAH